MRQASLFDAARLPMGEAMELTAQSLTTYRRAYRHGEFPLGTQ